MSWLGIDLGTGSVKLLLAGNSVVSTLEAYPVSAPQPGYAETPVEAWLAAIRRCTARMDVSRVEAISFSGQMHGIVPLSFTKGVLSPAILWADQRGREVFPLLEDLAAGYRQRVRNPWAAGMALTTILWLKRNRPEIYRAADVFLHPKDYIRYALTGTLGTEPSDASGSLMFDMEQGCWMGELLEVLGLEPEKLPPVLKSDEIVGTVTPEGAAWSGLPSGTRVAAGAGDTPAAIYGSGLDGENSIQISIGTAMQVVRLGTTVPEFHPALNAFSAVEPGTWYRMAAMLNGGLALEWIRSTLGIDWDDFYSHTDTLSPPWDLQFLPYLTGERTPYLNPDARAVWSGLGLHHKPADLLHAGLFGVACSVRLGLETLGISGVDTCRLVGGSSRYPYWNQLLSDVLELPLEVLSISDASAWGAARLAAKACGVELCVPSESIAYNPHSFPEIGEYFAEFRDLYQRIQGN